MVLVQLSLHRLLRVPLVSSRRSSLLLHCGLKVALIGAFTTHDAIIIVVVARSHHRPAKLHCNLGDDDAGQPQPQCYLDPFAGLHVWLRVVAVTSPTAFVVPLVCRRSPAS